MYKYVFQFYFKFTITKNGEINLYNRLQCYEISQKTTLAMYKLESKSRWSEVARINEGRLCIDG